VTRECLFPIAVGSSVFPCVLARGARMSFSLLLHHLCEAQVMQQQEFFCAAKPHKLIRPERGEYRKQTSPTASMDSVRDAGIARAARAQCALIITAFDW